MVESAIPFLPSLLPSLLPIPILSFYSSFPSVPISLPGSAHVDQSSVHIQERTRVTFSPTQLFFIFFSLLIFFSFYVFFFHPLVSFPSLSFILSPLFLLFSATEILSVIQTLHPFFFISFPFEVISYFRTVLHHSLILVFIYTTLPKMVRNRVS